MVSQTLPPRPRPIPILFHESYFTQFYGAQISLVRLLEHIDRDQFQPLVVCPGEGQFTARARGLGIEVVIVPLPPDLAAFGGKLLQSSNLRKACKLLRLWPQVHQLARLIGSRKIQLMHCNTPRSVLSSGWAAKLAHIPLVCHVRGYTPMQNLDRVVFALSDKIIAVSEDVGDVLAHHRYLKSTHKLVVVRNGIPLDRFDPHISGQSVRKEFGFGQDDIVLGTVGALENRKGHHTFIEMAGIVAKEFPNARFLIVGDSSDTQDTRYKNHLLSLGHDLIADGRLVLAGWRDDMPRVYAAMDVFVLASSLEGLGLVVLESMAMTKPTIRTMAGGANDTTIDGQTGYLVPIGDAPAMAAATRRLVANRDLRAQMGAAARDRATTLFSVHTMVQGIEQVFLDSLSRQIG
jgi:glycosyltransferase involved in cell wall biosynthesis